MQRGVVFSIFRSLEGEDFQKNTKYSDNTLRTREESKGSVNCKRFLIISPRTR